jgi:hypothetical protein
MQSSRFHARSAVLDQVFVPDTTASILDNGAMASIIQGTQETGSRIQLVGVTGDDIQAEIADVTFPVLTATNELYVIDTTNSQPGSTLLVEKTKDNIISLAILLKSGFKVDVAVGSADDSFFGGNLYTPEGILIKMVFHDNLWHIPMCRPPSIVPPRTIAMPSLGPAVKMNNYYTACATAPGKFSNLVIHIGQRSHKNGTYDGHRRRLWPLEALFRISSCLRCIWIYIRCRQHLHHVLNSRADGLILCREEGDTKLLGRVAHKLAGHPQQD